MSGMVRPDEPNMAQNVENIMTTVAIVGATGAVGKEALKILESRNFPVDGLRLFASERSAGGFGEFLGSKVLLETPHEQRFIGTDIVIFSAGSKVSREWAPVAARCGCIVIDNSSAFRMDPDVPLVVPEINGEDVKVRPKRIIANPNCTTAITLMALWPLHMEFGVKRIFASSYQAVSGAGQRGIDELSQQLAPRRFCDPEPKPKLFPHSIAHNLFPQVGSFQASGYTDEEEKMVNEGRRIMHHPTFAASVTCVRVPIFRAHSIAVSAEFERPVDLERAFEVLSNFPGLTLVDGEGRYPTPKIAAAQDDCFVGRVRKDSALDNGLSLFVAGDQIRKGAALNAVQIAELVLRT
jgi:aspartate-semialdehyde dehydrogenase